MRLRCGRCPESRRYFPIVKFLQTIWEFPAHHMALAWWLAAALTLGNFIVRIIGGIGAHLSLLGRRYQQHELPLRIRTIERLHDNTNGLIRYLAEDLVDIAIEACWSSIPVVLLLLPSWRTIGSLSFMFMCVVLNIATSVVGRASRIKALLKDLKNYPESVEALKEKLSKLQA